MRTNQKLKVGIALLLLIVLFVYAAVLPVAVSRIYMSSIRATVKPFESSFEKIRKSAELPLMNDPSSPTSIKADNATYIRNAIGDGRQRIRLLTVATTSFTPLPYSDIFGQYKEAEILQDRTQRLIAQTDDALEDYSDLVDYVESLNKATDNVYRELDSFNSVSDINTYGGQVDKVSQVAGRIRGEVANLSALKPPAGIEELHAAFIKVFNEAASGFDELAVGLSVPADDPIYIAVRKIETATIEMDRLTGTVYGETVVNTRIIKNIEDLSEKLELVEAPGY